MELKPLNEKISKLVDEFLRDSEYYDKFEAIAQTHGVISSDTDTIRMAMFSIEGEHLIFVSKELENLFTEWQLFKQLVDREPYGSLIKKFPKRKSSIMNVAHRLLEGKEVTDEDIIDLFRGFDDER